MTGVAIIGIGQTRFGRHEESGLRLATIAVRAALADAGLTWRDVDIAVGGSMASGNADTLVSTLGATTIPFFNVRNGCATGASALTTAAALLAGGEGEVALVVGFDKHPRGAFNQPPAEWGLDPWYGEAGLMLTTQFFAMKIQRYAHEHGIDADTLARVAAKAFAHGAEHPLAWRRTPFSREEVLASPPVNDPLTKYMFCSPGEGAAALLLCSAERARELSSRPVRLRGVAMRTRRPGSFEVFSPATPVVEPAEAVSPSVDAARAAFEAAGVGPEEVDVAQLQDTDSGSELIHMAECGFCADGEQPELLARAATDAAGALPINTDGGCIANGEPIGASGVRQVCEVVRQLRGSSPGRQVPGEPRVGFTHVYGAPGLSACTVVTR